MAGIFDENIAKVIRQKDPEIPDYLNFDLLKKEGLEHIGRLAGKIWTDHNVHDPGITILEVLIYALMDLGYKTNLPFRDLISFENANQEEDNFLTPLKILTLTPVTILDYRKLLLECPGVRNAWIEPAKQEVDLILNKENNTLNCVGLTETSTDELQKDNIELNGLYKIYIEKDNEVEDDKELKKKVQELWSKYRNLCEDLIDVTILEPLEFGICANVEIRSGFDASKVYKAVLITVKEFIQPQVKYYTLKELLDKGRSMEEIFAGRPYLEDSVGFVDTEEFEALERRKAIYLSDLYNVILQIEGVRKIKLLKIDGGAIINDPSHTWIEANKIGNLQIPVFSLEKTCVDLYSAKGLLNIEKNKLQATLPFFKKFEMSKDKLDAPVPSGKFYKDLSRYYSIQNDFPVVYGIGEEGLPDNVSLNRKTQALQLKGYLLFYDQLLANYTSQLANIRSLFSLKSEADRTSEEKRTSYVQVPDTVPGIEKLLKFYEKNGDTIPATELALPVANDENWQHALQELQNNTRAVLSISNSCGIQDKMLEMFNLPSATLRASYIKQLADTFTNEEYEVEVLQDRNGYFFVLHPFLPRDILLVGSKRYTKYRIAANEGRNVAFLASISSNYNLVSDKSENLEPDMHYFSLKYHPVSYLDFIQEIVEDDEEYSLRRQRMLDHLLARFGEDFTDYTLLKYRQKIAPEELQRNRIQDQSVFLNDFADISRNRGKAFDYLQPSWDSSNVSGFEKRISLLSGIGNYDRRNLCNIEVTPCYQLQLKDENGELLLKASRSYESEEAFTYSAGKILEDLRKPSTYEGLRRKVSNFNLNKSEKLFSEYASEDNIIISSHRHEQQLLNDKDEIVVTGKYTRYNSVEEAREKKDEFIKNINRQNLKDESKNYKLLPVEGKNVYLDVNPFEVEITKHSYWKWQLKTSDSDEKIFSEDTFPGEEEAWQDLIENAELGTYLTEIRDSISWEIRINDVVMLAGERLYRETSSAEKFWDAIQVQAQNPENYSYEKSDENSFRILLNIGKEKIAFSQEINTEVFDPEATIRVCAETFSKESPQPKFSNLKLAYGFFVPGKNNFPDLESYHAYSDPKKALDDLRKVYTRGTSKRNYEEFGEEGENDLGFSILIGPGIPLAQPTTKYETETERNRALNAAIRFFKKEEPPVSLKKQPNKYTWALPQEFQDLVHFDEEYSSNPKARAAFEEALLNKAAETDRPVFRDHFYHFGVETSPSWFKFLYGNIAENGEFKPLLISNNSFSSEERTKDAYTKFVQQLPQLLFRASEDENVAFEYALYESSAENPVAFQYQQDSYKASLEEAKTLVNYFKSIYDVEGRPKEEFIAGEMLVNREPLYEWKFYKKNNPLVINPYRCEERENAENIKKNICDIIPPINLDRCPPKSLIICPDKDPKKYHYQLCFSDAGGREFTLISFRGYENQEEALHAWEKEWYQLLLLAKDPEEYGADAKISLEENYRLPEDISCDDSSYLAVIPAKTKATLIEAGEDIAGFYTQMAHLFPIYELEKKGEKIYKFKVTVPEGGLGDATCEEMEEKYPKDDFGSLIWLGTEQFSCYSEAVKAYNHFYILAGISQNCRVFCEKGKYYVGLVEVLVESFCRYTSKAEAWDDAFASVGEDNPPHRKDACGNCLPGGVRSFLYASDDPGNFIPVCIDNKWTFKVVEPLYFLASHTCSYNSEAERDQAILKWENDLKNLNWEDYINLPGEGDAEEPEIALNINAFSALTNYDRNEHSLDHLCELVFTIRECLEDCNKALLSKKDLLKVLKKCLLEKYTDDSWISGLVENLDEKIMEELIRFVTYFPVVKNMDGHCYRIYWPDNDKEISEDGLQPCNCEENPVAEEKACGAKYPFVSDTCFSCCEEALEAFRHLAKIIKNGGYAFECIQDGEYGPYLFQIIDTSKELGYHPQRYENYQDVLDAIEFTRNCTDNMGMHLLEHILLRPKNSKECREFGNNAKDNEREENCLLPICPDYCCPIEWFPDMDKDDPCAEDEPDIIHYLPGSDPYSFWATLALPSWIKNFRTPDARTAFEQMLYKEVPALVGLNILWLSPRDMCRFEDKFRVLLDWLQDPALERCDPDGKHPVCRIAGCIKELESEPACSTIPGAEGDCNCENKEQNYIKSCCLPPQTEGSIFWRYCKPEVCEPNRDDGEILLSRIRERNAAYLENIERLADEEIKATKSYKRTISYLNHSPTIKNYAELVNFFNRYSLKENSNEDAFLQLLQNATWHLLDNLVMDLKDGIPKEDMESLQENIHILSEKGLSVQKLYKNWNPKGLGSIAYPKPINQINKLLNLENGK